jgi:hypothetical protein
MPTQERGLDGSFGFLVALLAEVMEPDRTVAVRPAPQAVAQGAGVLALEVYADMQSGRLDPVPVDSDFRGRSVAHPEHGVGRVISATGSGPDTVAVVRFERGPMSVPAVELFLVRGAAGPG